MSRHIHDILPALSGIGTGYARGTLPLISLASGPPSPSKLLPPSPPHTRPYVVLVIAAGRLVLSVDRFHAYVKRLTIDIPTSDLTIAPNPGSDSASIPAPRKYKFLSPFSSLHSRLKRPFRNVYLPGTNPRFPKGVRTLLTHISVTEPLSTEPTYDASLIVGVKQPLGFMAVAELRFRDEGVFKEWYEVVSKDESWRTLSEEEEEELRHAICQMREQTGKRTEEQGVSRGCELETVIEGERSS